MLNQWTTREVQERCFLTRDDFTPKRHWIMSGDIFDCHTRRCCWHLMGGGCCSTSHSAQTNPISTNNYPASSVNSAEVEKPWCMLIVLQFTALHPSSSVFPLFIMCFSGAMLGHILIEMYIILSHETFIYPLYGS